MHQIPLLINIAVALCVAFVGGLLARRVGLPAIVGYLLAGVVIGPFTPGFVGDIETISQLSELGVIFLMFGVGLHFSLRDLWKVRDIAVPGAVGQMAIATVLGLGLTQLWGWSWVSGLVLGLSISIASTVVLLRGLMDNGLLNTRHGQVAVGWLVLEDLATILILLLLPILASTGEGVNWIEIGWTLVKAAVFVVLMMFVGTRVAPWLLLRIAAYRSRELFILLVLALAMGTALGSAELFGVSLALGAFLAGVVINESPLSHQVAAEALPFRDTFAVVFFVSVGMLVNPAYLWSNIWHVLALSLLIILGKALIAAGLVFLFPHPARTGLVVAAGLSQIGEFSFILGTAGLHLHLLTQDQYSLILAGALVSITLNPLMFRLINPTEKFLQRFPNLWRKINRHGAVDESSDGHGLNGHVVIIGYGRVGQHIVDVLGQLDVPRLVIESDPDRMDKLTSQNVRVLYGDAANSEILTHANLEHAKALVVTLPEESSTELIVAAARTMVPTLPIIARAATSQGVKHLAELGAKDVIHPELEGGLEIVRHTLLRLGYPLREVERYAEAVRRENYYIEINTDEEHRLLHELIDAVHDLEITWIPVTEDSPLVGMTLAQADIRARTGTSVVALHRDGRVVPNPKSQTVFQVGDRLGLIGDEEHIQAAEQVIDPTPPAKAEAGPKVSNTPAVEDLW
jgi:monovalent cation:H+ antiporter-2, CPA2 family